MEHIGPRKGANLNFSSLSIRIAIGNIYCLICSVTYSKARIKTTSKNEEPPLFSLIYYPLPYQKSQES